MSVLKDLMHGITPAKRKRMEEEQKQREREREAFRQSPICREVSEAIVNQLREQREIKGRIHGDVTIGFWDDRIRVYDECGWANERCDFGGGFHFASNGYRKADGMKLRWLAEYCSDELKKAFPEKYVSAIYYDKIEHHQADVASLGEYHAPSLVGHYYDHLPELSIRLWNFGEPKKQKPELKSW